MEYSTAARLIVSSIAFYVELVEDYAVHCTALYIIISSVLPLPDVDRFLVWKAGIETKSDISGFFIIFAPTERPTHASSALDLP